MKALKEEYSEYFYNDKTLKKIKNFRDDTVAHDFAEKTVDLCFQDADIVDPKPG